MWIPTDSMMSARGELRERMEQQRDWNEVASPDFRNRQFEEMEKERKERMIKPDYLVKIPEPRKSIYDDTLCLFPKPKKEEPSFLSRYKCPPLEEPPIITGIPSPFRKEPKRDTEFDLIKMYKQIEEDKWKGMQIMEGAKRSCESKASSFFDEIEREARRTEQEREDVARQMSKWRY